MSIWWQCEPFSSGRSALDTLLKQFGHMEINEARRLKELERENNELKKMLAESLLKNRVLEAVCEKKL
jgi:putative transposase